MELMEEADIDDAAPDVSILNENDEKDIREVLSIIKGQSKILNVSAYEQRNPLEIETLYASFLSSFCVKCGIKISLTH